MKLFLMSSEISLKKGVSGETEEKDSVEDMYTLSDQARGPQSCRDAPDLLRSGVEIDGLERSSEC